MENGGITLIRCYAAHESFRIGKYASLILDSEESDWLIPALDKEMKELAIDGKLDYPEAITLLRSATSQSFAFSARAVGKDGYERGLKLRDSLLRLAQACPA